MLYHSINISSALICSLLFINQSAIVSKLFSQSTKICLKQHNQIPFSGVVAGDELGNNNQGWKKYGSLVAGLPANFKSCSQSWLGQRSSQPFYPYEQLLPAKQ